jgi:Flp pilus assembly protein TadG
MKRSMHRLAALAREEAGAALLEFALFAGVLLVLTFGIIDFGRALFTANNLTAAAREGARYAAVLPNPAASTAAIQQRVATYMSPFGSAPIDPATQVLVTYNSTGSSLQSITVEVHYPFTWLTPIRALLGGSFTDTLHARARFRWEQAY